MESMRFENIDTKGAQMNPPGFSVKDLETYQNIQESLLNKAGKLAKKILPSIEIDFDTVKTIDSNDLDRNGHEDNSSTRQLDNNEHSRHEDNSTTRDPGKNDHNGSEGNRSSIGGNLGSIFGGRQGFSTDRFRGTTDHSSQPEFDADRTDCGFGPGEPGVSEQKKSRGGSLDTSTEAPYRTVDDLDRGGRENEHQNQESNPGRLPESSPTVDSGDQQSNAPNYLWKDALEKVQKEGQYAPSDKPAICEVFDNCEEAQ
mgnify:CR=1 FL=1